MTPTTKEPSGIYAKLLAFQRQGLAVKKTSTNPAFRSRYADLNEVLETIKQPLTELGVLIVQLPTNIGLITRLIDVEDGSNIESFLPYVDTSTAQKLGANNTYNRRYALVTMLGLEDEDDDGNTASSPTQSAPQRQSAPPTPKQIELEPLPNPDFTPSQNTGSWQAGEVRTVTMQVYGKEEKTSKNGSPFAELQTDKFQKIVAFKNTMEKISIGDEISAEVECKEFGGNLSYSITRLY